MERSILYNTKKQAQTELTYYIIADQVSQAYCKLEFYGAKIVKTTHAPGGKTVESCQINNIFYHRQEIEKFMKTLVAAAVEPADLRSAIDAYIAEHMRKARKTA